MKRLVGGIALAIAIASCNKILDNTPGAPKPRTDLEPTQPPAGRAPDDGLVELREEHSDSGPTCGEGERECNGACVSTRDPLFGCGDSRCEPCRMLHGSPVCGAGNRCAVGACDRGWADCNRDPRDGCESDLSLSTSCGACGTACPPTAPVCAPYGATFQCTTGCPASAPALCGSECVSTDTSTSHCGACDAKCPSIANADMLCTQGQCGFSCKPTFHACSGKCASDLDPTACGLSCLTCPAPTNATATCESHMCSFRCQLGFGDCNQDATDGCETSFTTDSRHCGACGRVCPGGTTCLGAACVPRREAHRE